MSAPHLANMYSWYVCVRMCGEITKLYLDDMCSEKGFFPRILELRHFALHLQGEEVVGAEA